MPSLVFLIIVLCFFFWCMKKLTGEIPGGHYFSKIPSLVWGWLTGGEKVSGARFQKPHEERRVLNPQNRGLVIDGAGKKRLSEKKSFEHIAVVSPTGAGKTTSYIVPNLLKLDRCSMVVTDPSGEIHDLTSGYLALKGFDIKVFHLENPELGFGYNPVSKANTDKEIHITRQKMTLPLRLT